MSVLARLRRARAAVIALAAALAIGAAALPKAPAVATLGAMEETAFEQERAHAYSLRVELDEKAHTLSGIARVSYYNGESVALPEAAFHLYANGYRFGVAARYAIDGQDAGSTELLGVKAQGEAVVPRYANGGMLAVVPLKEPLRPGKRADIEFSFVTHIPRNRTRFGYSDFGYNVTGAYPIAAVPGYVAGEPAVKASAPGVSAPGANAPNANESGANATRPKLLWKTHPFPAFGDPFFSQAAHYSVTLTLPEGYQAACTGSVISESRAAGRRVLELEAQGAREFAFCTSREFSVDKARVGNVQVELYTLPNANADAKNRALECASMAVEVFAERFGPHPFQRLCVAQSGLLDGGMEYPGLILIDATLFTSSYGRYLEHIVVHEAAHQWWYALVGSEQYAEPWLDEALTEYSASVYYGDRYGEAIRIQLFKYFEEDVYSGQRPPARGGGALSDYPDAQGYSRSVYAEGAKMYERLRAQMGDGAFFAALREYAQSNAFGIAKKGDLLEVLQGHGGDVGIVEGFLGSAGNRN